MSIEAMKQALEALEQWNTPLYRRGVVITALSAAIEQAEKQGQEPVALKACWYESKEKTMCRKCGQVHAEAIPPAQPKREPLSDEQIWDAYMEIAAEFDCNVIDLVEFARAIESAHGIKENT